MKLQNSTDRGNGGPACRRAAISSSGGRPRGVVVGAVEHLPRRAEHVPELPDAEVVVVGADDDEFAGVGTGPWQHADHVSHRRARLVQHDVAGELDSGQRQRMRLAGRRHKALERHQVRRVPVRKQQVGDAAADLQDGDRLGLPGGGRRCRSGACQREGRRRRARGVGRKPGDAVAAARRGRADDQQRRRAVPGGNFPLQREQRPRGPAFVPRGESTVLGTVPRLESHREDDLARHVDAGVIVVPGIDLIVGADAVPDEDDGPAERPLGGDPHRRKIAPERQASVVHQQVRARRDARRQRHREALKGVGVPRRQA